LAPELDGALDAVENLTAHGVKVAFGHTNATLDDCEAAMDKGKSER
jgi:N-acetylglucosamine-6-phosphate deacetylase